jgi:sugar O-acyltransferase (sialic acid O-acetyltransferase NeuD family)
MSSLSSINRLVLWGASGHAKVLRECMHHGGIEVVAVCDRDPSVASPFPEVPIVIGDDAFDHWLQRQSDIASLGFLVAIGGQRGSDRLERHEFLRNRGLTPLIAVHPTAFVAAGVKIGDGSQVLAQAAVCVDVVVGKSCIINTAASVDHECEIGDGAHIGPGARLAGLVHVGRRAMIGIGAMILPRIRIGEDAIVGAGAVVLNDVEPSRTVVGNPARAVTRTRPDVSR